MNCLISEWNQNLVFFKYFFLNCYTFNYFWSFGVQPAMVFKATVSIQRLIVNSTRLVKLPHSRKYGFKRKGKDGHIKNRHYQRLNYKLFIYKHVHKHACKHIGWQAFFLNPILYEIFIWYSSLTSEQPSLMLDEEKNFTPVFSLTVTSLMHIIFREEALPNVRRCGSALFACPTFETILSLGNTVHTLHCTFVRCILM